MIFLVSVLSILIMIMKATRLYSMVESSLSSSCSNLFFSFSLSPLYLSIISEGPLSRLSMPAASLS